jgi:hypothetical protein
MNEGLAFGFPAGLGPIDQSLFFRLFGSQACFPTAFARADYASEQVGVAKPTGQVPEGLGFFIANPAFVRIS